MNKNISVALAGNPNIGKTTLLNSITGSNYSVGNWAGVTVEKKEGYVTYENSNITIVDLPGTYSLSAYSIDESIAQKFLVNEDFDIILNLVDATNLERNLYLTLQLMELNKPIIMAMNMMDEAANMNMDIDIKGLSKTLGIPIVPIVASKKTGINDLLDSIVNFDLTISNHNLDYGNNLEKIISDISNKIKDNPNINKSNLRWFALRIIEGDPEVLNLLSDKEKQGIDTILDNNKDEYILDYQTTLIDKKYEYISSLVSKFVSVPDNLGQSITSKIDYFITHKYFGLPIFALIMFFMFYFTFDLVGDTLKDYTEGFLDLVLIYTEGLLNTYSAPTWLTSLIVDGMLRGVFGIISFLPNIACLFFILTLLEDSGYMARVAFIMDRLMKQIGLNGKAIIPMLLGFGCNVPAIMSTRTLDNENDRLTAILINPFMSCSARLPIYTLFAAAFFPGKESLVIFSLYFLGIIVAIIVGLIFKKTILKSSGVPFVMELPPYRVPRIGSVLNQVWEKVHDFLIKAGTVIFIASGILWFLLGFNFSGPSDMSQSIGASIGKVIAPIFTPLGFGNWEAALSLLSGVVAKEIVVSNMLIIYGAKSYISNVFTPISAYAFMTFTLLYVPCVATIGVVKRETNSSKWMWFSIIYQFVVAWGVSFLVYNIGRLFI